MLFQSTQLQSRRWKCCEAKYTNINIQWINAAVIHSNHKDEDEAEVIADIKDEIETGGKLPSEWHLNDSYPDTWNWKKCFKLNCQFHVTH